jgi:hypothetical protein
MTWKGLAAFLAFVVLMGMAGTALAFQFSQSYQPDTLYGQPNGKPWSPSSGILEANLYYINYQDITDPHGNSVTWGSDALNYIKTNGQKVYITFHSFRASDNGCSAFEPQSYGWATNLPNPGVERHKRQCWPSRFTEIKIFSNSQNSMQAGTSYYGKAQYNEYAGTNYTQMITVDTYYGGNENWHQKYCFQPNLGYAAFFVNCP